MAKAGNRLQNGKPVTGKNRPSLFGENALNGTFFPLRKRKIDKNPQPLPFRTRKYRVQQSARFRLFPAMPYKNGTLEGAVFMPAL